MKTWRRAAMNVLCGGPRHNGEPATIRQGEPLLELTRPGWSTVRCAACADEPVPDDLDTQPLTALPAGAKLAERLAAIRPLQQDWKHSQAGDR